MTRTHPLDNPMWHALAGRQAALGVGTDLARRFQPSIAPFGALAAPTPEAFAQLADLMPAGDTLVLLGVEPPLPAPFTVLKSGIAEQWVCTRFQDVSVHDTRIEALGEQDIPDMLDLIALVYPGYFRARTIEMGPYLGVRQDGQLVAMAGERLFVHDCRELSAVCTHPSVRGRGLAAQLMAALIRAELAQGLTPFLHVDSGNERAVRVYRALGFELRRALPLLKISRA